MWQNPDEKVNRRKIQQENNRQHRQQTKDNRIKNRKLGAGAKRLLDSDDKIFIAEAIQENALLMGEEQIWRCMPITG